MISNNDWRQNGIVIGETATALSLNEPDSKPKTVLTHKINLTPEKSSELLDFLKASKEELERIQKEDEQRERELLARVYSLIMSWPENEGEIGPQ